MKYIKLFLLLAVAVVAFSACSDDDNDWNSTAGTTVSLPTDTIRVRENTGLFNIPVYVKGAHNGKVKVTVSTEGVGDSPAVADSNYIVTSYTNVVSADTTDGQGFIQIETVDDNEVNVDREFKVTITSADGAQIGNSSVVVVIRDNDSEFYDKLQGSYTLTAKDFFDDTDISWNVNITGATDESDPDYNKTLYLSGIMNYSWCALELSYHYDQATQKGYVAFDNLGSYYAAEGVNFGSAGVCNVVPIGINGNNYSTDPIEGNWSSDFSTITFNPTGIIYLMVVNASGQTLGGWDGFYQITLTKK